MFVIDPNEATIKALHRYYEQACGFPVNPNGPSMRQRFIWERWQFQGTQDEGKSWGMPELKLVIGYIQRKIRAGERRRESFKFSLLVEDTNRFSDDLSIARSEHRAHKPTDRDRVLESTGREPRVVKESLTTGQILSQGQLEGLAALRKLKESLK